MPALCPATDPRGENCTQICIAGMPRHADVCRYSVRHIRTQPGTDGAKPNTDVAGTAKLLVVLLAFAWGFNWIAAAVALREVSPWSLRFAGSGIGAATLFAAALLTGHNLKVPRGEHVHVMVAGFLNVAAFQILSGFAQLSGATSRAIIITYSMPIWTTVLSRFVLGERLNAVRWLAFALCVAGLTILVWPLFAARISALRVLLARLRAELGHCHGLHQMGEGDDRAAGQRRLAIAVRFFLHRRRHVRVRRLSASLAAVRPRRFWRFCLSACSASASRISCGGRSSVGCRPSRRRSARCWCR